MELAGEVTIGVPPLQVWDGLNDANVLRACIPGCEEVQQLSPTETHTRVLLKLGPVRARFVGKILMSDVRPGEGCTLNFEGSGGAAGFARGSSVVRLEPEGAGTRLHYTASAAIGGKLGQIGGRMIDASARQMADQFFRAFRATLDGDSTAQSAIASNGPATADLQAAAVPHGGGGRSSTTGAGAATDSGIGVAPLGMMHPPATAATAVPEYVRVLWFVLGMGSTGFGVWLASHFGQFGHLVQ